MGQADIVVQLFQSHLDVAHIVHYLVLGMNIVVNVLSLSVQIAGQSDAYASITLVSTHEHLQCNLICPAGLYDCLQSCVRLLGHDSHEFYQILGTSPPPPSGEQTRERLTVKRVVRVAWTFWLVHLVWKTSADLRNLYQQCDQINASIAHRIAEWGAAGARAGMC